jgi:monoamine oxidase
MVVRSDRLQFLLAMTDTNDHDVIVVGAGAAGLTAAVELGRAGLSVLVVEGRERIGGRILTLRSSANEFPIELGAEFIHGLVPQVWNPLQENQVEITEVAGDVWCWDGQLVPCDFTGDVDRVLDQMDGGVPDQSFAEFLRSCCKSMPVVDERTKKRALSYVVGFNAADPEKVGVHWLAKGMREEHAVMGDRAFRSRNGYEDLLKILRSSLAASHVTVMTNIAVTRIHWKPETVTVSVEGVEGETEYLTKKAVVTVPLSILRISSGEEGAIEFNPPLPRVKLDALDSLEMGRAFRLVLRFRERFWDSITPVSAHGRTLGNMSFLLTEDEWFPTWWTTMPYREPQITGWAPFQCAERLSGKGSALVTARGLESLGRIMRVSVSELEQLLEGAYFHDWQSDPHSRGAYSYGKVGADGAQQALAKPLADSLYFAGEATASPGSNGTVHGAIASGYRVATEILASRP